MSKLNFNLNPNLNLKNSRATSAVILDEIIVHSRSLSIVINKFKTQYSNPDPLIQALCCGVLRFYPRLKFIANILLDKPLKNKNISVLHLILIGLYQLEDLNIPDHAAIFETVAAAKVLNKPWAKHLINAILRKYQKQKKDISKLITKNTEAKHSHPKWLLELLQFYYPNNWQDITTANNQHPPQTIRINSQKTNRQEYIKLLAEHKITAIFAPKTEHGLIITPAQKIQNLPGFNQGFCSIQDSAAQYFIKLLSLTPKLKILDACSAPGGKACYMLEQHPDLEITLIDISKSRVQLIQENLQRLKLENLTTKIITADANNTNHWCHNELFDRILLDAPCSATGIIRRQPDVKMLCSPASIEKLNKQQKNLLNSLWPLLKPGGIMLYATCSVLPSENKQQITNFLKTYPQAKLVEPDLQIIPGENNMDGFYYAAILKT